MANTHNDFLTNSDFLFRSEHKIVTNYELGEKDTNDINNMNGARQNRSNTERVTQLAQFIRVLYQEEVNNSKQQRNANVVIAPASHATPRDETKTKQ